MTTDILPRAPSCHDVVLAKMEADISESDYDNLFVVVLGEKPYLIRLHYR